jgi:hypothetical protein
MLHTFSIDPEEVLGVRAGASLQEIHSAYREKVKKYHPDVQGDPWAFRVVSKSYELLSASRVATRLREEQSHANPVATPPPVGRPLRPPQAGDEQIRPGVRDAVDDPAKLVDVDVLLLRYALDDPAEFFLLSPEERNLSCSMNLMWPSRRSGKVYGGPSDPAPFLKALGTLFPVLADKTKAIESRARTEDGRFTGWLSYPTASRTSEAFQLIHKALKAQGFGVDQRNRELFVPRESD